MPMPDHESFVKFHFANDQQAMDLPAQLLLLTTLKIITDTDLQAFSHIRGLPARILAQILERYILLLGQAVKQHAELCGREQPNVEDAVDALQRFGFSVPTMLDWTKQSPALPPEEPDSTELKDIAQLLYG
jgi:hypothetical protein